MMSRPARSNSAGRQPLVGSQRIVPELTGGRVREAALPPGRPSSNDARIPWVEEIPREHRRHRRGRRGQRTATATTSTGTRYRLQFTKITEEVQSVARWRGRTPMRATGCRRQQEVFELARCPAVSADHGIHGNAKGYRALRSRRPGGSTWVRGGILGWTTRAQDLPRRAGLPVPAAVEALGAVHRRDRARGPRRRRSSPGASTSSTSVTSSRRS